MGRKIEKTEAHGERDADLREHRAYCPGFTVHAAAGSFSLRRRTLYHTRGGSASVNADKQISLISAWHGKPRRRRRRSRARGVAPKAIPCPEARLRGPGADSMHIGKETA